MRIRIRTYIKNSMKVRYWFVKRMTSNELITDVIISKDLLLVGRKWIKKILIKFISHNIIITCWQTHNRQQNADNNTLITFFISSQKETYVLFICQGTERLFTCHFISHVIISALLFYHLPNNFPFHFILSSEMIPVWQGCDWIRIRELRLKKEARWDKITKWNQNKNVCK